MKNIFLFFKFLFKKYDDDFWLIPIQYGNYIDCNGHKILFLNILTGETVSENYYNHGHINDSVFYLRKRTKIEYILMFGPFLPKHIAEKLLNTIEKMPK